MRYIISALFVFLNSCNSNSHFSFETPALVIETPVVYLQPFGRMDDSLVEEVYKKLNDSVNAVIKILPPVAFPLNSYYKPRNRYLADSIIYFLQSKAKPAAYFIGLTDNDISTQKNGGANWGVMGLGYKPGNACVASTYRLKKGNKNLKQRFYKVIIHELGHNYGLPHCANKGCYMMDAEGKMKMDEEHFFCQKCHSFLALKSFFKQKK
jgi:archaemetzincin